MAGGTSPRAWQPRSHAAQPKSRIQHCLTAPRIPSPDWSSADPTAAHCDLRPSWTASADTPRKQASPRITLHDLRHLAATLSITAGTPLTVVSKTLRHFTLSTTANLYSHLTQTRGATSPLP
ncbi:tyrosine-type recombinase/integrase [Streptomyces antimycoticus]|uniref:tyrosine-type recombinase/integrase n=1 Tax=Streptomyces antimycoticus TaxID=68175 RepID=UPI000A3695C6